MTECGFVRFIRIEDLDPIYKKIVKKMEKILRNACILLDKESITGVYEKKAWQMIYCKFCKTCKWKRLKLMLWML